jgi:hypothetical protein
MLKACAAPGALRVSRPARDSSLRSERWWRRRRIQSLRQRSPFVRGQGGRARNEVADPTGLVVDGGPEFNLGRRFSLLADARYVPIETKSRAIVSFGVAHRF